MLGELTRGLAVIVCGSSQFVKSCVITGANTTSVSRKVIQSKHRPCRASMVTTVHATRGGGAFTALRPAQTTIAEHAHEIHEGHGSHELSQARRLWSEAFGNWPGRLAHARERG